MDLAVSPPGRVHVDTLLLQRVLAEPKRAKRLTDPVRGTQLNFECALIETGSESCQLQAHWGRTRGPRVGSRPDRSLHGCQASASCLPGGGAGNRCWARSLCPRSPALARCA